MSGDLMQLGRVLAELLDDLDGQHRREQQAYAEGYRDGHRSGWDIGYGYRCTEEAKEAAQRAEQIRKTLDRPPYQVPERIRRLRMEMREKYGIPMVWCRNCQELKVGLCSCESQ